MGRALIGCCPVATANQSSPHSGPILSFMQQLPMKTSSGHDNISNVLLKSIGVHLLTPLTRIFNDSISMGVFPDIMKLADMVPLYKAKEKF